MDIYKRLFLSFGGPVCADRISNCPLDRVLTYKNLIYLLNLLAASCARSAKSSGSYPAKSSTNSKPSKSSADRKIEVLDQKWLERLD